jgi:cellulose synthase/poly-beta-1,6-N-acetylglucosamine synthase-like glycosyltransferase
MSKEKKHFIRNPYIYKDDLMFIVIIGLWIITLLYFNPKILHTLYGKPPLIALVPIYLFVLCLNFMWLLSIYHLVLSFFSAFIIKPLILEPAIDQKDRVAILYLTMNDFVEEAILSCCNQDYDNFNIFLLDDSTGPLWQKKVDDFVASYKQINLVRRPTRDNYKAGNLNYTLERIYKEYKYFAIADADSVFPIDFIKKMLPYFSLDERVAFVQANHRQNTNRRTPFIEDLELNADSHYIYYMPAKAEYGFVMLYGHGALIRTDVWKGVDGFPNCISEDLVFSSILRERGYLGVLALDVICKEDFPSDYKSFRIRYERWVEGSLLF